MYTQNSILQTARRKLAYHQKSKRKISNKKRECNGKPDKKRMDQKTEKNQEKWAHMYTKPYLTSTEEIRNHTEYQNQAGCSPDCRHEISVLTEHALGHLRCRLKECRPDQPPLPTCLLHRSTAKRGNSECKTERDKEGRDRERDRERERERKRRSDRQTDRRTEG